MVLPSPSSKETIRPWAGYPLFSMANIHHAYRKCRRRKRNTLNALAFEYHLERNLVQLQETLESGTYVPKRYLAFLVHKPKRREIFAADFRDRVVHHVIACYLNPEWEKKFIYDSYACRVSKGTHAGVDRLHHFLQKVTKNQTQKAYYLQLDIKGFFIQINKGILFQQLRKSGLEPAMEWLIQKVLFFDPTKKCRLRKARMADFLSLPDHKTLFKSKPDCGLPIGNLTSQLFANIYLDPLDQFIKHQLKAKYYLRYCDDLVILHQEPECLLQFENQINTFLQQNLDLQLNSRRSLKTVDSGINFLGYISRPDYRLVRRRVVGNLKEKLHLAEQQLLERRLVSHLCNRKIRPFPQKLLAQIQQTLVSYMAHFKKANSHHLISSILEEFAWLRSFFSVSNGQIKILLNGAEHTISEILPTAQDRHFDSVFVNHLNRIGGQNVPIY